MVSLRKVWSKKEIRSFIAEHPYADAFLDKKSFVVEEDETLSCDRLVVFRRHENAWIPSLELLREHQVLPKVVVDKGTPPFIAKGADLMRPGVVSCESFGKGAIVAIVDEVHGFPLASGRALFSSDDLLAQNNGKVVRIIHNLTGN